MSCINANDRQRSYRTSFLSDREYESYDNLVHIQEKGWYFIIRIKDNTTGKDEYDIQFELNLTRARINSVKKLSQDKNHYRILFSSKSFDYLPKISVDRDSAVFYKLHFRVVRFTILSTNAIKKGGVNYSKKIG